MPEQIKYVIVGGGIAGTTAAETIRGADKDGSIAIISDEPYRLYSRIMLSKPNFFLEKIPFDNVWLKKESWYAESAIQFISGKKAVGINAGAKIIELDDGRKIQYDKLLLAIGGCARQISNPGSVRKGIFSLRTLDDAKGIIAATKTAKHAVAIGGGFVSFEMCDMLRLAGVEVTLLIREPYYWQTMLDETSGLMIEDALQKGGVNIIKNVEVDKIDGSDHVEKIVLKDGRAIVCDMIIAGVGVFCPLAWIATSGVAVNKGILTDEYLQTNVPDIYAAGDAAEFKDVILEEQVQLGNWVNAQMQGKIAGLNMTGKKEPFRLVSFYTTQGFGITIAFVGDVRLGTDRVIFPRGSAESGSYGRIITKDGEIIGATLMNRTQELGVISKLIETNFKIAGHESELSNPDFKLQDLLK